MFIQTQTRRAGIKVFQPLDEETVRDLEFGFLTERLRNLLDRRERLLLGSGNDDMRAIMETEGRLNMLHRSVEEGQIDLKLLHATMSREEIELLAAINPEAVREFGPFREITDRTRPQDIDNLIILLKQALRELLAQDADTRQLKEIDDAIAQTMIKLSDPRFKDLITAAGRTH